MTSASTLARRASKTKNKAEAKRLRAESAQLRREEREAKRFQSSTVSQLNKPRPADKIMKGLKQALEHAENMTAEGINNALYGDSNAVTGAQMALNQLRAGSVDSMPLTQANQPGRGEIVGGYLAGMAEELAKLGRTKGGVDTIQSHLMTLEYRARTDAKFEARQNERKAVQAAREEMRDKMICGFIALIDAGEQTNSTTPVSFMSADLIANIVDALKANGYTPTGKR